MMKTYFQNIKTSKKFIIILLCTLIIASVGVSLIQRRFGLQGRYYTNSKWEGEPIVSRVDKTPHLKGGQGYDILSTHVYSVRWSGWIIINQSGTYRFATNSDDGSHFRINGQEVVNNGGAHGLRKVFGEIRLKEGIYSIEILYFQGGGESFIQTLWTPPEKSETLIPAIVLFSGYPGSGEILLRKGVRVFSGILKLIWGSLLICTGLFISNRVLSRNKAFFNINLLLIIILGSITFGITYFSAVDYTAYDPLGNLLTSQAILRHGTIKLDAYEGFLQGYVKGWHLRDKDGHVYYHYPIGTPLFAIPSVWLANLCGAEMSYRPDEAALQNTLSALTTTLSWVLIYLICRCYLPLKYSLLLSLAFVFGSSIASTMGTALWSINLAIVFTLSSLLLLVYEDCQKISAINPYLLGFFLFSAYLCRPTTAIFACVIFLYVFFKNRLIFSRLIVTYIMLFGIFVLFSWMEYRQVLPDYYLSEQLGVSKPLLEAVYGILLSPARGLLVYIPYLIVPLIGAIYFFKQLSRSSLFWVSLGWFILHLVLISKNELWWGGGGFGSRMFTDALPALILLTLLIWNKILTLMPLLHCRIMLSIFILLAGVSIFINTYQGLYNTYTVDWGDPWQNLFNWKYPQFLASHRLLAERDIEEQENSLQPYTLGDTIYPGRRNAIFSSWYWTEGSRYGEFRWSRGPWAKILFKLESPDITGGENSMILELSIGAYQKQHVEIFFNGEKIGALVHENFSPSTYPFLIDNSTLNVDRNTVNAYNTIEFLIPDAIHPASVPRGQDRRALGISVWQVRLYSEN